MDLRELSPNFYLTDDTIIRPRSHRGVELQMDSLIKSSYTFSSQEWGRVLDAFHNIEDMLEQSSTLRDVDLNLCSSYCADISTQEIFRKGKIWGAVEVDTENPDNFYFSIVIYGKSRFCTQLISLFEVERKCRFGN